MLVKTCKYCGYEFKRTYQHKTEWKNQRFCSRVCRNRLTADNNIVRGYWLDKDGYAIRTINIDGKRRNFRLHRLAMEEYLGRPLNPYENVHHKNGNRVDNRIENLELFDNSSDHIKYKHLNASKKNLEKAWLSHSR